MEIGSYVQGGSSGDRGWEWRRVHDFTQWSAGHIWWNSEPQHMKASIYPAKQTAVSKRLPGATGCTCTNSATSPHPELQLN